MSDKHLYRDPRNAAICGICSGIAERYNWDLLVVRVVALLLLVIFPGITFIIYIVLRLVLPEKPARVVIDHVAPPKPQGENQQDSSN